MSDLSVPAPRWSWRRFGGKFLILSILFHVVFGVVATYFIVQTIQTRRKLTFTSEPPSVAPSTHALEHRVQMAKRQQTMSAPPATQRVVTTGQAKFALPPMPAMPSMNSVLSPARIAGTGGNGVGLLPFGATGGAGGTGGGKGPTLFGFRDNTGGSLVGTFYDLKQDKEGKPTNINDEGYKNALRAFVQKGWNDVVLQRYFKGPDPIYATQFFIPLLDAAEGPKAFNLADKVQPKMWVVHYKGKVIPPESGTYRFVGIADDILVVRFNGRVVLDCGSELPTQRAPPQYYGMDGMAIGAFGPWSKGLGRGEPFQVNAGNSYPMEVLLGEFPGGQFKAFVMLEKQGFEYKKDSKGNPILPIFKLAPSEPPQPKSEAPVFSAEGPIWKAEKPALPGGL